MQSSSQLREHRGHITSPLARHDAPHTTASSPASTTPRHPLPSLSNRSNNHDRPLDVDRVRVPNPAKKAGPNPALDEVRKAAAADAVREEAASAAATARHTGAAGSGSAAGQQRAAAQLARNVSAPLLGGAVLSSSPPASPSMSSLSRSARQELQPTMNRTASLDSTVSSQSSASIQQRANGTNGTNGSSRIPDPSGPQDADTLIAAAGSAEAAVLKLLSEKNSAASHSAQLWRLVEKQRAMILGLTKDMEKMTREKDRYKRKLKESLVQSTSAGTLASAGQHLDGTLGREDSQSPVPRDNALVDTQQHALRDGIIASRQISDASEVASITPGRSDTPQDSATTSSAVPSTPQSASSVAAIGRKYERSNGLTTAATVLPFEGKLPTPLVRIPTGTPPISPKTDATTRSPQQEAKGHKPSLSISSAASPPPSAASFSGAFKGASRKAPPAPLQLSPNPYTDATATSLGSDSEYEEDPQSARADQMARGRRKTREDDDREREAIAREEEEHRSRSMKSKSGKSKSKSQGPGEQRPAVVEIVDVPEVRNMKSTDTIVPRPKPATYEPIGDPAAILRQRTLSDGGALLQRNITAPSLMSPGLPMSPRPGDRPPGSAMPRAPQTALNSMPLSPRAGIAGLPLSPRPPRQPIPMPPQTPLAFASPHLARAEAYQHQTQPSQSSIGTLNSFLKPSQPPSPDRDHSSMSSDPKSPGDVYRGFVSDQYPDLLLPPNALPSIFVKTASSRMRPSRVSMIVPKSADENPVFTLSVHERSEGRQLWRVEKTHAALSSLDHQIRQLAPFKDRFPDKSLFAGHAPSKIDARRHALDTYLDRMLDVIQDERAAKVVCKFLSTDAIGAESSEYFPVAATESRPDTPVHTGRVRREGYLTKRGKNFGGWKARYFVLDGPALKYFEAPGGAQLGVIKLQNAQIGKQSAGASRGAEDDEDNQFRHAFLILEPKRKDSGSHVRHVLCAESDQERDRWVDALLQYVDYRDEGEEIGRGVPIANTRPDVNTPRLQKSFNDLRPASRGVDRSHPKVPDPMHSVGYEQTVAGEAPVMGMALNGAPKNSSDSPVYEGSFSGASSGATSELSTANQQTHPTISAPSNVHVIQNAGDWGMKAPPTPGHQKDKKRGIFAGFRGRSSSDLQHEKVSTSTDHNGRAVFGVPLVEAVGIAHPVGVTTDLPAVFYRCIEYLTVKHAIAEEGIFRLSGSNTVIKALRERFNSEGDVDLVSDGTYYDIHAVASLLKLYLRELPASILTRELHMDFLSCLEMGPREKVVQLNILVHRLPTANRALLETLAEFLLSIVSNADVNKMNVRNVGIVFAPTLNVPGPLILSFVEEKALIFGPPLSPPPPAAPQPRAQHPHQQQNQPLDLRSPRKQMFSDLPTPAYNQTTFAYQPSSSSSLHPAADDGGYAGFQMAPMGEGGYGSLNDALRSPGLAPGVASARDVKRGRRESAMMLQPGQQVRAPSTGREGGKF
ncbi:Rho GTPase activating protein [Oleoguttula sp. CCFEE 5521]